MSDRRTVAPKSVEATERYIQQIKLAESLPILTEEQAASLLQVSMMHLRRLRERNVIPCLRIGKSTVRYVKADLMEAIRTLSFS